MHNQLLKAIKNGDIKTVEYLLNSNIDITINNNQALYDAVSFERIDIIKLLVKNGATSLNWSESDFRYLILCLNNKNIYSLLTTLEQERDKCVK
jgi:ankyrin repeat protein